MSRTAYQVRGRIAKTEPKLGKKKGDEVWLGYTEESGGWYQWGPKGWAHTFTSKATAIGEAKSCPGPWYNMPDQATIEVIEGQYTPAQAARFTPNV